MVNISQTQSIWNIFRVGGHLADRGDIFRLEAICNAHLIQIGIAGKRENGRILILPAKLAYACLSRRLQNRDLDRLAVDQPIALTRLSSGNRKERLVAGGLYKAISQRVEHCAQGTDIFGVRYMLLGLRTYGTVVDN